jgi:outer membrane protein assembly factor BamB
MFTISLVIIAMGCSGGGYEGPTVADNTPPSTAAEAPHYLWGLWQFRADPAAGTLDVIPLRVADMHLNALPFLEPPPLVFLSLESLEFIGNIIEANIGLRHPFLGLTEFTGFDVCGVLITNGSYSDFDDPDLVMAGDGDTRLLNPDGWSRWWNPAEFPHTNTMFGYKDGLLGTPDSVADYNCTLNAYKYFCDDLDPNDTLDVLPLDRRGIFSAGQKNVRHYTIELGAEGLVFNYAVDACWQFPDGSPPWTAPDDFAPEANRPEAYRITTTEVDNTLWAEGAESGGELHLLIDVYDWFNAGLNTVQVESADNFEPALASTPIDGGPGYSTYQVDIIDAHPVTAGIIDLFITVESDAVGYGDLLPGEPVCAYFFSLAMVDDKKPEQPPEDQGWLQGYFNAQCTNWNPASKIELPLTEVWSVSMTRSAYRPPITRGDQIWITTSDGYLQSYDATGGSFLWEQDIKFTGSSFWAGCNPLIWGDKVIEGGTGIYCYDKADGAGPDWVFKEGSDFLHMGGVIVGDTLFWRSCHARFYCIDLTTGTENWSVSASTYPLFNPSANDDYVIYPSGNGIYCYDHDGNFNWHKDIGGNFYGGPLIHEGKAYFGYTSLMCVDIETGNTEWTFPYAGGYSFTRTLVLADDRIVAMTRISNYPMRLYCVDMDGDFLWQHDFNICMTTACYSNGHLFTVAQEPGSSIYRLVAIDATDGTTVETVGNTGNYWGGVACTNNRLYFADNGNGLYCYE